MDTLKFDLTQNGNKFKLLNATNGGPWHKRHATDQYRSNFEAYKAARIPYSRNHDSQIHPIYGGPHAHDISFIFPRFEADPCDPASYDFACTDEAILVSLDAGTKTFFRLGQTIEHQIKKHGTLPPADFHKWAVICEHIIRHYTEGWADGFYHDMPYWEIWNEPDLDEDDSANKRCWGGTKAQFFDFYEIAAKHLKKCFPHLKIGGPACAGIKPWTEDFLSEMQRRNVEIDFLSWHVYGTEPQKLVEKSLMAREMLDRYGYTKTESILNEWNYVRGWREDFLYSIKSMHGIKGAAFTMACICEAQQAPIDMLMYYDTRPSVFCGAFDLYTYETLKGYYPLYWYGGMYDMEREIPSLNTVDDIYSLCGVDKDGKVTAIVCYYTEDDEAHNKQVTLDFGRGGEYDVYLVDKTHDGERIATTKDLTFDMNRHSFIMITEK